MSESTQTVSGGEQRTSANSTVASDTIGPDPKDI